jgi:integrase
MGHSPGLQDSHHGELPTRHPQCSGGSSQSTSTPSGRLPNLDEMVPAHPASHGKTGARPIRDKIHGPSPEICDVGSRSASPLPGRILSPTPKGGWLRPSSPNVGMENASEGSLGKTQGSSDRDTRLEDRIISTFTRNNSGTENTPSQTGNNRSIQSPPVINEVRRDRLETLRELYKKRNLPDPVIETILRGCRDSSNRTYQYAWSTYWDWCIDNNMDVQDFKSVLSFLQKGREQGLSFATLRLRLNAISTTLPPSPEGLSIGQLPIIEKFMKGLEATCPKKLPTRAMWDLKDALVKLSDWTAEDQLSLSCKTAFILAVTTMWRPGSDLSRLVFSQTIFNDEGVSLLVQMPKEGDWKSTFLPYNTANSSICPVTLLRKYLHYVQPLRVQDTPDRVFLVKNRNLTSAASADTIARWIRQAMSKCGIDTSKFSPHSTRSTATSSALQSGMDLPQILRAANWANAKTFQRFYYREIIDPPALSQPQNKTKISLLEAAGAAIEGNPSIGDRSDANLEDSREAATAASEVTHLPPPETKE